MNSLKRILALIVAGIMLVTMMVSFTACGENTTVALTIDGKEIPAGVYIYYLSTAYYELESELNPDATTDFDLYSQVKDGKAASEIIIEKAIDLCKKYVAIEKEAERLGVSLDQETKDYVNSMVEYYWTNYGYSEVFGKMGISQDSFYKVMAISYLEGAAFEKEYGEGGAKEVKKEELSKFMIENYARVKYYTISKMDTDSEVLEKDALASLKKTATQLVSMINTEGATYDKIIDEYEDLKQQVADSKKDTDSDGLTGTDVEVEISTDKTSDKDSDTSKDTDKDKDTDTEKDPYEKETMIYKESTTPTEDFVKLMFEKKPADYGKAFLYEDDKTFYVTQVLDPAERTDYFDDNKSTILSYYKYEEYDTSVDEIAKALTVERNEQAIKRYEPKKIGVPA